MRIRYTRKNGDVVEVDAVNLLVSDDFGNPVIAARQQPGAAVWVTTADDPAFDELLRAIGQGNLQIQRVTVS